MNVVHPLEPVDVDQQDREGALEPPVALDLLPEGAFEVPPVPDAGEVVGERHALGGREPPPRALQLAARPAQLLRDCPEGAGDLIELPIVGGVHDLRGLGLASGERRDLRREALQRAGQEPGQHVREPRERRDPEDCDRHPRPAKPTGEALRTGRREQREP